MILIVDSGSTKTDWCFVSAVEDPLFFRTEGINPIYVGEKEISELVRDEVMPRVRGAVTEVNFFGAGCNFVDRKEVVERGIGIHFPSAKMHVYSDLKGACIALFGNQPGIADGTDIIR